MTSDRLTEQQLAEIERLQRGMQARFRSVPESGVKVEYLGKEFIVYRNVFWPFEDSKPLVENCVINPGDCVLDVGTGSGVIAIFSAYKGANKVIAVDINPECVRNAKSNTNLHGFSNIIDVRLSDLFDAIRNDEKFDVITANLPFRNRFASGLVEATQWDTGFDTNKRFFYGAGKYLKQNGRIYLAQANFGNLDDMQQLANKYGFDVKLIGQKSMLDPDPRIFYAFELTRK